jgi:hypothetical protein
LKTYDQRLREFEDRARPSLAAPAIPASPREERSRTAAADQAAGHQLKKVTFGWLFLS